MDKKNYGYGGHLLKVSLEIFGSSCDWLTPNNRSFRPPSWPPPREWVVSEDRDGKILSLWGDSVWDISPWAGKSMILDFGDDLKNRRAKKLDAANADLLRVITTWRMWGVKSCRSANGMKGVFLAIRRLISLCSDNRIVATELMRFPKVFEQFSGIIPPSEHKSTILELHRLWDAREHLGFYLVDPEGIKRLAATSPKFETEQTAYIPPRIWTYQVERLKACLDDYLAHQKKIEDCFHFCVDAYAKNSGSLEAAFTERKSNALPFWSPERPGRGSKAGYVYHGRFSLTAERFGIAELIEKWVSIPSTGMEIRNLSAYMSLVQNAGLAYITNFTLQRTTEASSLRADSLIWELDEKLGRIPIICGETTKTDADSDARWPTTPSVEVAVKAMSSIAHLRMRCTAADPYSRPSDADIKNPYLFGKATEPWSTSSSNSKSKPYSVRTHVVSFSALHKRFERLFDENVLRITEADLRIAKTLTPNLSEIFSVGRVWPLAWHQLRRTGAVNMFASGLLSDSSLQFQMKHASRLMPLYYGRGYTKLLLNEEVEGMILGAMYEAMANKILVAVGDRFVSPIGNERKQTVLVNLVSDKDASALASAGRRGQIFFREMRVGACTHRGTCPYGGIESISRCTGGDGNAPCADALYDRDKVQNIEAELRLIDQELAIAAVNSPRHRALLAERKGLENYLNVVRS